MANNVISRLKKFLQQYWRETSIVFLLAALVVSVVSFLRERNKTKKTEA